MKWLLTTILILASTNVSASTAQHSHSALGELAARALEKRAQSQGLEAIQVEVFPLDLRMVMLVLKGSISMILWWARPSVGYW